jgi:hypothetical protein
MAQLLMDNERLTKVIKREIVVQSIKGENIEVLSWACSKLPPQGSANIVVNRAAMNSNSAEVFEIWEKNFAKVNFREFGCVLDREVISVVSNPMQEIRLVALWKDWASLGRFKIGDFGRGLLRVAQSTCSIVLARALLECGADVNVTRRNAMTPLYHAAKKTTTEAAELMKFLLLSGANPNTSALVRGKTLTPSMERGARNISKWLGMTWDELVKWAQEERKKRSQNDEGSVAE